MRDLLGRTWQEYLYLIAHLLRTKEKEEECCCFLTQGNYSKIHVCGKVTS